MKTQDGISITVCTYEVNELSYFLPVNIRN